MGVPPAGEALSIAVESAASCTELTGATLTAGAESTPQYPSVLKNDRPTDAVVSDWLLNASPSALMVVSQRDGSVSTARFGSELQDSTDCTGGALHAMLPLR